MDRVGERSTRISPPSASSKEEDESIDQPARNKIVTKRYSHPADIVGAAAFLASPESDNMTGQRLMIDGGMVMQLRRGSRAAIPFGSTHQHCALEHEEMNR